MGVEGSSTRLAKVIHKIGRNDSDRIELATVTSTSPLRIKIDHSSMELDESDFIVAEQLTTHTRIISIGGGEKADAVLESNLEIGDRVIISSMNHGQTYVLFDRAVIL